MDKKLIIPEIQKKNSNKLHRNATLDSTTSSIRLKKVKLYDGLSPLITITKNTNINQILDFPVFMSVYTNSFQKTEKPSNNKSLSNRKIVLKNINNFKIKNLLIKSQPETKKELLLPKVTKNASSINLKINGKGTSNITLKTIQSDIQKYLHRIKKLNFQSSRNYSKPRLKKINNIKLTKFTQRNNSNIKISKNFEKSNKGITIPDLINISEIKNKKNISSSFRLNSKKKIKEINNKLPNGNNNINRNIKIDENNINNNINRNIKIDGNNINNNINKNIKIGENNNNNNENNFEDNKKFYKKEKNIIEKNEEFKENVNKINSETKSDKVKNINPIINIKGKITNNLLNKIEINNIDINTNTNNEDINNNKLKEKTKKLSLKFMPKKSLNLKKNKNIEENEDTDTSRTEKEEKISKRRGKLGIRLHNKKANKFYQKYKFLKKMNEEVTRTSINSKINSKMLSKKENLLINIIEGIRNTIFNGYNKIITHSKHFLTNSEIKEHMKTYYKEVESDDNFVNDFYEKCIFIFYQGIHYKFNCLIGNVSKNYLFEKYESNTIILNSKADNEQLNKNNLITNFKNDKKIQLLRKSQTFGQNPFKRKNNYNSDNFSVDKSVNVKIHFKKSFENLMIIQEYLLKSLPYYNEDHQKLINDQKKLTKRNVKRIREKSRRFQITDNFKKFFKKNSFNAFAFPGTMIKRKGGRRKGSILSLETVRQTIRIQSNLKGDPRESSFSILKQKNFFKKLNTINECINENENQNEKHSSEKELGEINEEVKKLETIYLELIKDIFEGNIKQFKSFFTNNKKLIDINQNLIDGNTLLIMAVKEGNFQIAKFLCEEEADVNIQNVDGNTALHYAIGKQFYSIADILTTYGAKEDLLNLRGFSPWDCIENNVD